MSWLSNMCQCWKFFLCHAKLLGNQQEQLATLLSFPNHAATPWRKWIPSVPSREPPSEPAHGVPCWASNWPRASASCSKTSKPTETESDRKAQIRIDIRRGSWKAWMSLKLGFGGSVRILKDWMKPEVSAPETWRPCWCPWVDYWLTKLYAIFDTEEEWQKNGFAKQISNLVAPNGKHQTNKENHPWSSLNPHLLGFKTDQNMFFLPSVIPTSSPGHPARAFSSVRNTEMSDASSAPGFFVQRPSGPRKSGMPESVPFNCALPWNQVQNMAKHGKKYHFISIAQFNSHIFRYIPLFTKDCAD